MPDGAVSAAATEENRTMNAHRPIRGTALAAASTFAVTLAIATLAAAFAQPSEAFAWRALGTLPLNLYHRAAAFDEAGKLLVLYGGLDIDNAARANIDIVDVADPSLDNAVRRSNVRPSGPVAALFGSAASVRSAGGRRQVLVTGGANTAGDPYDQVQVYDLAAGTWASVRPSGRFDRRVFHASAYDPNGDVLVVHGGSERCDLFPAAGQASCEDPHATTQYLVFNALTDAMAWENGPTGPRVYGHSMVWDPQGRRVLLYGGTYDGIRGSGEVWQLDLTAGRAMAAWTRVDVAPGLAPEGRALHAAAFDTTRRQMAVYGGATRTIYRTGEVVATQVTWALDVTTTPPTWRNLGAPVGDRIGAAMAFAPSHGAALMYGGRGRLRSDRQTVASDVQALIGGVPATPTTGPTPRPSATPLVPLIPQACAFVTGRVPSAAIADALANPRRISGFGEPANPSLPPGANNPPRLYLSLLNTGVPWHPLSNSLIYKVGCP